MLIGTLRMCRSFIAASSTAIVLSRSAIRHVGGGGGSFTLPGVRLTGVVAPASALVDSNLGCGRGRNSGLGRSPLNILTRLYASQIFSLAYAVH
jgi:hypothetical protein